MKKGLIICFVKVVILLGRMIGRGSSFPGIVAKKLDKNILMHLIMPKTVIAVTGSSGKGSTSKMICDVYRNLGYSVTYNDMGSNQDSAIITSLIANSKLSGKIKTDIVVMEIDERYTKYVFPYCNPNYVVITNITRDQPPRQAHFDSVFNEIYKSLNKDVTLVLNGDDPYLKKFDLDNSFKTIYYSINKLHYSYDKNIFNSLNITYCPKCNSKLSYNYYHIEHIGNYVCPKCGLKTPDNNYTLTDFDYNKNIMTINNTYKIEIGSSYLFNLYNTLAAFTTLSINKLDNNDIVKNISSINKPQKQYTFNERSVFILNNKNENNTTFNHSLLFTIRDKKPKTIVIGWKEISRRYEFDDLSWLYDIEFELLNSSKVDKIICVGPQRYDIAVRMKYAGISEDKIKIYPYLNNIKNDLLKSEGNIYAILNFDYVKPFEDLMEVKQ